jgi:hypothetical protein
MYDTTFPIWILTMNGGIAATAKSPKDDVTHLNCHEGRKYPRTADHPCNDVLKALFVAPPPPPGRLLFQSRVHLMDNTDLVLPIMTTTKKGRHDDYNITYDLLLANTALRIFVAVGKGVTDWRRVGQHGLIDGLHRNDTVEPNIQLKPYNWSWSLPSP